MAKLLGLAFALLLLLGCEDDQYRMLKSPDGKHWWYVLSCSGNTADCRDEALAVCGSPYEVKDKTAVGSQGVAVAAKVGSVAVAAGSSSTETEMLIQCARPPSAPLPSKYAIRVCRKDPLMRSNMEWALACPPRDASK